MAGNRDCHAMLNIERMFFDIMAEECRSRNLSISAYIRHLVIYDLHEKQLISDRTAWIALEDHGSNEDDSSKDVHV